MTRRSYHRASESERREDLINATLDCIAEFGIQGATVRQIATRAGVTGGLIRHYFDSKDQMIQAAYRQIMENMLEPALTAADQDLPARRRLCDFIVANLTPPVTDVKMLSLWAVFIGQIRIDPAIAAIHRENYLVFLNKLEDLISCFFRERGEVIDSERCRQDAIALNGLIDGLWLEGTLAADMFRECELAQTALTSVERLLGLRPGELSA
ncbi:TetR family transcriptional regulator C-terminal domain-containing protein [Rhizobium helianthi]|uniref:TetR family transcriptional regulator C-terminal domain-containing protein n=1 Tax=Rhizobium helianthi TaxID=1132695 RepID=A0ABW4M718_9HYPH